MHKDFLSIDDIMREEIFEIFDLTSKLKKDPIGNQLKGKIFVLLFEKLSTRTRISFEVGIKQLSGDAIYVDPKTTQLSRGETIGDTGKALERYVDGIIMRSFSHEDIEKMAQTVDIPVINTLSDLEHPCQTLADLFTIREKFGDFNRLKLAWIGDGNNICNSLILGSAKVGMDIAVACPKKFGPDKKIIDMALGYTKITKSSLTITTDPRAAVRHANIVYNDTFISMGSEREKKKRLRTFLPHYQVNKKLMSFARGDAIYMHCLPAHRGQEVTDEVIDGPQSVVWDQAENRLHTQKALLIKLMNR